VIQLIQRVNGDWSRLEGIDCEMRGFEAYQSVEAHRALRSRRRTVVHQVLKVQQRQQREQQQQQQQQQQSQQQQYSCTLLAIQNNQQLEMAIAQSSRNESFQSQEWAYQMGLKDERVAQMAWQEFFAAPEGDDDYDDDYDVDVDVDDDLPMESHSTIMEDSLSNTNFLEIDDILDLMELDDE
jgi:hypothetical protein